MAKGVIVSGGGGSGSDDCTATRAHILAPYTAITKDSDDEPTTGNIYNHGGWYARIGVNGKAVIPEGYHDGSGYVDQAQPWQGAPEYWLPINGTQWLPEGYYSGGAVKQSIPVHGEHWITPARYQQIASTAGHYCTGNIIVNPIPEEYWNIYEHQTVFSYGSYGISGALGAYYCTTNTSVSPIRFSINGTPRAIAFSLTGGVSQTGVTRDMCFIFRGLLPNTLKFIRGTARGGKAIEGNQCQWYVVDPDTMIGYSAGFGNYRPSETTAASYDMSKAIAKLPNGGAKGYYLAVYTISSMGENGLYKIELAPWAL